MTFEELPPHIVKLLTDQMARIADLEEQLAGVEDLYSWLKFEVWDFFDYKFAAEKEPNPAWRQKWTEGADQAWQALIERYEEFEAEYDQDRRRLGEDRA